MNLSPWFVQVLFIVYFLLGLCFLLSFFRLFKGPSVPDRVVSLDLIAALAVGSISLYIIVTERTVYLDVAITLALIAFLSTVAFAHYLLKRGSDDE